MKRTNDLEFRSIQSSFDRGTHQLAPMALRLCCRRDTICGHMQASDLTRLTFLMRLKDRSDSLGWHEFQDRYAELLYRYARSVGASHSDAEDVVQEVAMYLFKAMDGFEYDATKGRFRSYLRASVVNALARKKKKDAKQAAAVDPQNFDFIQAKTEAGSDERWEREWRLHRLRWALRAVAGEFEEKTMQAFQLHVLGGMSVDDTAAEIGLSKASVYQAKSRVLKRVREQLESVDPDEDI